MTSQASFSALWKISSIPSSIWRRGSLSRRSFTPSQTLNLSKLIQEELLLTPVIFTLLKNSSAENSTELKAILSLTQMQLISSEISTQTLRICTSIFSIMSQISANTLILSATHGLMARSTLILPSLNLQ